MMPDIAVELLLPPLMKKLGEQAPGVRLEVVPWRAPATISNEFARSLDLIISASATPIRDFTGSCSIPTATRWRCGKAILSASG